MDNGKCPAGDDRLFNHQPANSKMGVSMVLLGFFCENYFRQMTNCRGRKELFAGFLANSRGNILDNVKFSVLSRVYVTRSSLIVSFFIF